ncbi:MAG: peptide-methionine (R)-S-oxide reductase MsrB [Leptolyngbyaceae cyanobacterium bins.349]|nr:peptide-methionine (R)-S-oxide reductase MsrB [Leptolyngbyaceae cyanobacterium bins.349]
MKKRTFLWAAIAMGGSAVLTRHQWRDSQEMAFSNPQTGSKSFELNKTEQEWRQILTPEEFRVLRQHGTEQAGSSPLDQEYGQGTYVCAGCDLPLFASETKYNSGTGWPSFWDPLDNAVGTTTDKSFLMVRTEVHCRRCGGHLGHVFLDGPKPTGKRYCMNGAALKFLPA